MSAIEKNTVYRALSTDGHGWRVWEIRNVVGATDKTPDHLGAYGFQDRDGNWWAAHCDHFWTEEHATGYFNDPEGVFESIELVTGNLGPQSS